MDDAMPVDDAASDGADGSTVIGLLQACGLDRTPGVDIGAEAFEVPFDDTPSTNGLVPRHVLAHALQVALSVDLFARVPDAAAYAGEQLAVGRRILLDHGAIRTVAWPTSSPIPAGIEQATRILEPLGWSHRETYPLTRLRMTGHSYAHDDLPEAVGQWFVSELHPDDFSDDFRDAVERVLGDATDPLDDNARELLDELHRERSLDVADAVRLLPTLHACFARLHRAPFERDYETLLGESAEMAWIATEGTAFNHATDRVDDVERVAEAQRRIGRPMKESIEVSRTGRVRQTAYRATPVARTFRRPEGDEVTRTVPGSFFEFIDRAVLPDGTGLDLAFDTSNAQGIFAMTTTGAAGAGRQSLPNDPAGRAVVRPNTTFKPRRRALSARRQADFDMWMTDWGLDEAGPEIDLSKLVDPHVLHAGPGTEPGSGPTDVRVVLDIGFGHGESTIELAREQRDRIVIGIEVHTPGVATVLDAIVHDPLPHVRVVHGDALRFLSRIRSGTLDTVRIYFPDPWPKQRHHDRRLVRADVVGALTNRLRVGGQLHLATDIEHYARAMQTVCEAEPRLDGGPIERPDWRPVTRFEQRGLDEGRPPVDLLYTRIG